MHNFYSAVISSVLILLLDSRAPSNPPSPSSNAEDVAANTSQLIEPIHQSNRAPLLQHLTKTSAETAKQIADLENQVKNLAAQVQALSSSPDSGRVQTVLDEITQLNRDIQSLGDVDDAEKAKLQSLKVAITQLWKGSGDLSRKVADIEDNWEGYKLNRLVAEITQGSDSGTVFIFENNEYRGGKPVAMLPSIVTKAYGCGLPDHGCFYKLMDFIGGLSNADEAIAGYRSLFHTLMSQEDKDQKGLLKTFVSRVQQFNPHIPGLMEKGKQLLIDLGAY